MKYTTAIIEGCIGARGALQDKRYNDVGRFLRLMSAAIDDPQTNTLLSSAIAVVYDLYNEEYRTRDDVGEAIDLIHGAIDQVHDKAHTAKRVADLMRSRIKKLDTKRAKWQKNAGA